MDYKKTLENPTSNKTELSYEELLKENEKLKKEIEALNFYNEKLEQDRQSAVECLKQAQRENYTLSILFSATTKDICPFIKENIEADSSMCSLQNIYLHLDHITYKTKKYLSCFDKKMIETHKNMQNIISEIKKEHR